jgi:hypothetical protein
MIPLADLPKGRAVEKAHTLIGKKGSLKLTILLREDPSQYDKASP